jgi:hypothetical protein
MQHKTTNQCFEEPQQMYVWSDVVQTAGDNVLIPAPGRGRRIVLVYALIQNTTANATTVRLFQNTGADVFFRWLLNTTGSILEWIAVLGREGRMGENNSVGINLSGANAINVNLYYFVEDV